MPTKSPVKPKSPGKSTKPAKSPVEPPKKKMPVKKETQPATESGKRKRGRPPKYV